MAKKSVKSARKSAKAPAKAAPSSAPGGFPGLTGILLIGFLMLFSLAAGYAWRSYAPLPMLAGTPLGAESDMDGDLISSEEQEKIDELEEELEQIEQKRRETESELGNTQIKAILSDS